MKNQYFIGATALLVACNNPASVTSVEERAGEICGIYVQQQLRSPSTFELIESTGYSRELSREEFDNYLAYTPEEYRLEEFDSFGNEIEIYQTVLSYDAANAFGTPIRGQEVCTFLTSDLSVSGSPETDEGTAESMAALAFARKISFESGNQEGMRAAVGRRTWCCL